MKKQLILVAALSVVAVVSSYGQGTVAFNNGTTSKISTNNFGSSVTGPTAAGPTAYYYALFYSASATTVSGSSSAVAGQGSYAFGDSNWSFSGAYGTNNASAGRFIGTVVDSNGATVVNGVAGGASAQFVVIGWSANVG